MIWVLLIPVGCALMVALLMEMDRLNKVISRQQESIEYYRDLTDSYEQRLLEVIDNASNRVPGIPREDEGTNPEAQGPDRD